MPKIKGETVYIGGAKHFREIHVDAGGSFKAKLPKEVAEALSQLEVSASTMAGCLSAWDGAKAEYEALTTTVRKVIHYHLEMHAEFTGVQRRDMHFCEGVGLDLGVAVYNERKLQNRTTGGAAFYRYDHVPSALDVAFKAHNPYSRDAKPAEHLLLWTQEREDWFLGLCGAYEKLIRGLNGLFTNEKVLTDGIAKGRLLMGGGD